MSFMRKAVAAGLLLLLAEISVSLAITDSTGLLPSDFSRSCRAQQRLHSYIRCRDDDTFRPLQCFLRTCWCVRSDGARLNFKTFRIRAGITDAVCSGEEQCPRVRCRLTEYLKCQGSGFSEDSNGCMTCDCRDPCPSLAEVRRNCSVRCIRYRNRCPFCLEDCSPRPILPCRCADNQVCVRLGFGFGTCRNRLPENATCERPVDEEDGDDNDDDDDDEEEEEEGEDNDSDDEDENGEGEDIDFLQVSDEELDQITSEEEDEEQMEEDRRARRLLLGASARRIARRFRRAIVGCIRDYYCRRTGLRQAICRRRNRNGPCWRRSSDPEEECDSNGYFKPRLCRALGRGRFRCFCVFPNNGTRISMTTVSSLSQRPLCIPRVYPFCRIRRFGRNFRIRHGRTYVDPCRCTFCKCFFGRLHCSRRRRVCLRNCTIERNCTLPTGTQLQHGQSAQVDCNRCFCRFGRLYCTDRDCDNERNNTCARCIFQPKRTVCGRNGRTYPNRCFAVNCAGISPVDILDGPCSRINPCELYPCEEGEVCLRKGWVHCLLRGGCRPSNVRVCVNITSLSCEDTNGTTTDEEEEVAQVVSDELGTGDVDPTDTRVCGTDGTTYPAVCQLLQRTTNINVRYAGRCNSSRCRGGQVCGSDGITYENVCLLRSQSGGVRVDYRGACEEGDNQTSVSRICEIVEEKGLCADRNSTCRFLVRPSVGCCPICGGILLMVIDQAGLGEAALVDSGLTTLDDLMARIVQDEVFQSLQGRCVIEASSTATGNAEIVLRPMRSLEQDAQFCHDQAVSIARMINTPSSDSSASFQFLLGASTARAISTNTTGPSGGAGSTTAALSFLMIAVLIAVLFQ